MTDANCALFVVSTGRCGTQWLADRLTHTLGDSAVVAHEPLENDYAPREMLAAGDPSRLEPELAQPLFQHIDVIEDVLRSKPYIECGHPSWSSIPYIIRRFQRRVRVVHLIRHPVYTAFSWLTQFAYCPPAAPHMPEKILLSPFDEGVRFPAYRDRWSDLTPYEKALYYWLEVNSLASDLPSALRIRYEELFDAGAVDSLLTFAGLPVYAKGMSPDKHVDQFHYASGVWCDPRLIEGHPEVMHLAARMGYDPLKFDEAELVRRYRAG